MIEMVRSLLFETLGKGDFVRAGVAFAFTGAVVWGFVIDKVSAEAFLGLAGLAIGFYFRGANGAPRPPGV